MIVSRNKSNTDKSLIAIKLYYIMEDVFMSFVPLKVLRMSYSGYPADFRD